MESVLKQYNCDLIKCEKKISPKSKPPKSPKTKSIQNKLTHLQEQGKQGNQLKQKKKSFDIDSRYIQKNRRYGVIHSGGLHTFNYLIYSLQIWQELFLHNSHETKLFLLSS